MTKEETIKSALKFLVLKQKEQGSWGYANNDNTNKVSWNEVLEWIDQQSCGDLISRQAVIDTIETDCSWDIFNEWGSRTPIGERIINAIKSVPSVESEMEKGKWIKTYEKDDAEPRTLWKCSNCNEIERRQSDYCPNCGCKMYIKTRDVIDDFIKGNL